MTVAPVEMLPPVLNAMTHDYRKHEHALQPFVAQIIDERHTLTKHIADDGHFE